MIKKLLIIALFFLPSFSFAFEFTATPNTFTDQFTTTVDVVCDDVGEGNIGEGWGIFYPNGDIYLYDLCYEPGYLGGYMNDWLSNADPQGLWTVAYFGAKDNVWISEPTEGIEDALTTYTFCYSESCNSYTENGISNLITDTETNFENTTGASVGNVVTWTGNNLIKTFLGSAFALIGTLFNWYVAILIISVIVYFGLSALQRRRERKKI